MEPELKAACLSVDNLAGADEAKSKAFHRLIKASEDYIKFFPQLPEPTEPPQIVPTLLHAAPGNFRLGYNMMLDSGGSMSGKIPVVVVPARPEDLRRYRRKGTVSKLLAHLQLT